MLELYHYEPNIYYLKPLIALQEARAQFASHYFDPTRFEQFAQGFPHNVESDLNLEREGPVLVHEGTIVSSSFFMLEYLAEAFPDSKLLPGDSYAHYRARAWGQFVALQLSPGVCALGCARYLSRALASEDRGALEARLERIEPIERRAAWKAVIDGSYDEKTLAAVRAQIAMPVKRIEDSLASGPWLAGEQYSVADIDAFAMLSPLPALTPALVSETATPHIMRFLERIRARPAVQQALALARTPRPQEAFVPGAEASRWG